VIPPIPTFFDEFKIVVGDVWALMQRDIERGNYFSPNILAVCIPLLFMLAMVGLTLFGPSDRIEDDQRPKRD